MTLKTRRPQMKKVIEEILKITGWSQTELARRCNVDRVTIFRWMSAKGDAGRSPRGPTELFLIQMLERAKAGEFKQPAAAAS